MATKLTKPVARETANELDGSFLIDSGKNLIVTLLPGNGRDVKDMIMLKPKGTRRPEVIVLQDAYRYAIRCRVNREVLEKARVAKTKRAERLARQRLDSAERRLTAKAKKGN
jgi:hypothetical protein